MADAAHPNLKYPIPEKPIRLNRNKMLLNKQKEYVHFVESKADDISGEEECKTCRLDLVDSKILPDLMSNMKPYKLPKLKLGELT